MDHINYTIKELLISGVGGSQQAYRFERHLKQAKGPTQWELFLIEVPIQAVSDFPHQLTQYSCTLPLSTKDLGKGTQCKKQFLV